MSINNQNTYLNIEDAHLRLRTGNVYAQGINIGGITVDPAHGLQRVSDTGNVTSNTLQFANATTAFVTTANVTVGRDLTVTGNATVSSNLTVTGNATVSSNLTVTGNATVSSNLTVTGNAVVSDDLTVTGNTFYTNPASVLVDSNVVTEYTGPHDRPLRKYPEVALTANSDRGYVASASSSLTSTPAYLAFDGSTGTTWHTQYPYYTENGGVYDPGNVPGATGTHSGTLPSHELVSGYAGEYITLSLPNKIKMSKISINTRVDASLNLDQTQSAEVIVVVGSHDGSTWEFVDTHTVGKYPDDNTVPYTFNVNTSTYYEHVGLICTNTGPTDSVYNTAWSISKLAFYGHEEGSGSLDTTLKSVYNVPATTGTQLEVYYDAKDLTDGAVSTPVLGLGGTTINATVYGDPQVSGGAFVFDGTGDYIKTSALPSTFVDDAQHSFSTWFKLDTTSGSQTLFTIGNADGDNQLPHVVVQDGALRYDFYNNSRTLLDLSVVPNRWYHLAITFSGGNHNSGTKFYINGVYDANVNSGGNSPNATLDIQASSPLTIGGRHNGTQLVAGSIANFRLYSKALNADQVKELYDYQKDYFLGSKSQLTLYKGHLGVGVTEPSGQLELAGDERIQAYPPRAITVLNYHTHIEGHGEFEFYSSQGTWDSAYLGNASWDFTKAFENTAVSTVGWHGDATSAAPGTYQAVAVYAPAVTSGDGVIKTSLTDGSVVFGEWVEMRSPYAINVTRLATAPRTNYGNSRGIGKFAILGSNNGVDWEYAGDGAIAPYDISSSTDAGGYGTYGSETIAHVSTNSNGHYYTHHRLVVTHIMGHRGASGHPNYNSSSSEMVNQAYIRLFGTPGPTTLDKGSLTLGRSLDVPRVSRYDVDTETPRPEKLVVDFDTTVNSSPTDISGQGNHGTFYNGASYSAPDKAFNFDGTDDYIQASGVTLPTAHSMSVWFNMDSVQSGINSIMHIGTFNTGDESRIFTNSNLLHATIYGSTIQYATSLSPGSWYHVVYTFTDGTTFNTTNAKIYVNGQLVSTTQTQTATTLNLVGNTVTIGATSSGAEAFKGKISNPKLYSVILEPSEVQKLYRLGRTGRSMVISDTAVGIGKVPEAQLDVRGMVNVDGNLQINGFNAKRVLIGYQRYTNSTGVVYANNAGDEQYKNAWAIHYERKRAGSQIYIISDLCVAQAIGTTSGPNYRDIDARLKVYDGSTDRFSDVTRDWQRIDSSFFEYQRQNRIHFGPELLPGGNTITVVAQVAQSAGSGTHTSWGINIWGGRSFIEVFETMEA